jgi:Uma2 family endonuclease
MALAYATEAVHTMDEDTRDPSLVELRHLHETLEIPGHKVEILEGRLVVSPTPIKRHGRIVTWLSDALVAACAQHGWDRLTDGTVDLSATGDWVEPDFWVCPRNESTDEEWLIPAADVLLAVEVVSPSSRRADHQVKPERCALSGIPLYLVIDAQESMLTMFAGPSERGYLRRVTIEAGDKLELPEPFGITLDTATIPARSATK